MTVSLGARLVFLAKFRPRAVGYTQTDPRLIVSEPIRSEWVAGRFQRPADPQWQSCIRSLDLGSIRGRAGLSPHPIAAKLASFNRSGMVFYADVFLFQADKSGFSLHLASTCCAAVGRLPACALQRDKGSLYLSLDC